MDSRRRLDLYISKAINDFEDGCLDDAETVLLEAKNIFDDDRITSLLKKVQDAKASAGNKTSVHDRIKHNTQVVSQYTTETNSRRNETMKQKETQMMRNMLILRIRILKMQLDVACDRIQTLKRSECVIDNTKETEMLRFKANIEVRQGNFGRAASNLSKAERLFSEMSAILFPIRVKIEPCNEYLRMKKPVSSTNSGITFGVNKEEVAVCLKKAEIALSGEDLHKAEKWLVKSLRMCPTRNALEMLEKVQKAIADSEGPKLTHTEDIYDQNDEQLNRDAEHIDENTSEALKCFETAKMAFANKEFDKSLKLFSKAKRMNPSLDVDNFLKEVQIAKASRSSTDENYRHTHSQGPSGEALKEEAETYLEIAKNNLKDKNFVRAEQFVMKSLKCFPLKPAEDLRKKIELSKLSHNNNLSKMKVSALTEETCKENLDSNIEGDNLEEPSELEPNANSKDEAKTYLEVARNALKDKNLERAECFLSKSIDCYPTGQANELKKEIDDIKKKKSASCERSYQSPTYASCLKQKRIVIKGEPIHEKYLKTAEEFFKRGCFEAAEFNVLTAQRLCTQHCDKVQDLLAKIQNMKKERIHHYNNSYNAPSSSSDQSKCKRKVEIKKREPIENNESSLNEAAGSSTNESAGLVKTARIHCEEGNFNWSKSKGSSDDVESNKSNKLTLDEATQCESESPVDTQPHQSEVESNNGSKLNSKSTTKDSNKIDDIDKYFIHAQIALSEGKTENAESLLIIIENIEASKRSRKLYIDIVKTKHNIPYITQEGRVDCNVNIFKKRKYLSTAENAYINGSFKDALHFIKLSESTPYVEELKRKFESCLPPNTKYINRSRWYKKLW